MPGVINEVKARQARGGALPVSALPTHLLKTAPVGENGEPVQCAICLDVLCVDQEVGACPIRDITRTMLALLCVLQRKPL